MNEGTTIAGQIERLIVRLDGAAVCDACVTDRLNLSVTAQANVVTCALGGQAKLGAKILVDYGFTNVKVVEGGCVAWKAAAL